MHRTELHLWQTHRHCVERSSSLCMPSFMKSSLASWRTRMTLRETGFSDQSRKFLLQLSGLFWSLCGSMLISLRGRSLPGFTDGPTRLRLPEQARTSRRMWTMSALPDCRATNRRSKSCRAEADRCVASLQTGRCSAARRHDPNSNREEELNVSPYFNATWFTSF